MFRKITQSDDLECIMDCTIDLGSNLVVFLIVKDLENRNILELVYGSLVL